MAKRGRIHGSTLRSRPIEEKAIAARLVEKMVLPGFASGDLSVPVTDTFAARGRPEGLRALPGGLEAGQDRRRQRGSRSSRLPHGHGRRTRRRESRSESVRRPLAGAPGRFSKAIRMCRAPARRRPRARRNRRGCSGGSGCPGSARGPRRRSRRRGRGSRPRPRARARYQYSNGDGGPAAPGLPPITSTVVSSASALATRCCSGRTNTRVPAAAPICSPSTSNSASPVITT